jgi:hypothetical protein
MNCSRDRPRDRSKGPSKRSSTGPSQRTRRGPVERYPKGPSKGTVPKSCTKDCPRNRLRDRPRDRPRNCPRDHPNDRPRARPRDIAEEPQSSDHPNDRPRARPRDRHRGVVERLSKGPVEGAEGAVEGPSNRSSQRARRGTSQRGRCVLSAVLSTDHWDRPRDRRRGTVEERPRNCPKELSKGPPKGSSKKLSERLSSERRTRGRSLRGL